MTARCRSCDRAVSAPRVERARLVWVCARCADRTEVACARCGTPLTEPRRYSDEGFRAWCKPCGVAIRLDATATEQQRLVPGPPAPRVEETPREPEAPPAAPLEEPKEPAPPPRSHSLEITTEASSGADFRNANRVVSIVCRPREGPREPTEREGPWLVVAAGLCASALFVTVVWMSGAQTPRDLPFGLFLGIGILGIAFAVALGVFMRLRRAKLFGVTHVRAGPSGLEVARSGDPGWRVEASRVKRVYAASEEGVTRVRVQLEDGTQRELVEGLTEEEACEVVAHVDRALPGRQADRV